MKLILGDCLDILPLLDADSIDSCVTDPPYGLTANKKGGSGVASVNLDSPYGRSRIGTGNGAGGFMGKAWDAAVPGPEYWREVYRVLKPGAFLLAFGGTRTYHRLACAIEDAGFEIRDQIQWIFGSGFPKSHDVSKAIDKKLGAEREVLSEGKAVKRMIPGADQNATGSWIEDNGREFVPTVTAAGSEEAAQWEGWGTALKPAHEPIVVARKPLIGTVAENVLRHGTGGLNIDACKVHAHDAAAGRSRHGGGIAGNGTSFELPDVRPQSTAGRWPANIIHDGSDEVLAAFPDAKGQLGNLTGNEPSRTGGPGTNTYGEYGARPPARKRVETEKSAARFFYCAKATKADRNDGLEGFEAKPSAASEFRPNHAEKAAEGHDGNPYGRWKPLKNNHPTVKPTDLMRYLCRLVTPPGGAVLDPFAGSGSTGRGAVLEGFDFVGIEMDPGYHAVAERRIETAALACLDDLL